MTNPAPARAPVSPSDVGLYVHFPYCEKKCPYCDFNSHVAPHDDVRYADAILAELDRRAPRYLPAGRRFRTLYFGGGTPSLWDPAQVARVIAHVKAQHGLADDAEITLEANPGTVHTALFERFVAGGVTRFSIGAQSFVDAELVQLGRIHAARASSAAVRLAKASGARVSLDLMYAQPDQARADVDRSLDAALALEPDHVSAYTLTVEPGTALGRRFEAGTFTPMDDDAQAELIEHVTARLEAAGHLRYEVSSYAAPGKEAVHNTLYWVGGPYLGLGAGAHSYLPSAGLAEAERRANVKSPGEYERRALDGDETPGFVESLARRDVVAERLMLGVRTRFGLDLARLADDAGLALDALDRALAPGLAPLLRQGLLVREDAVLRPSARGFLFTDAIGRTMLELADAIPL
jgi:oxygen-independent coproporphyrinogen-3 oxidase